MDHSEMSNSIDSMEVLPHVHLANIVGGHVIARCLQVAAELGIADQLKDGPKSATELAIASNSHAPSLLRILRALASQGIFKENETGVFEQTKVSHLLVDDIAGSQRNFARMFIGDWFWKVLLEMKHAVITGEAALPKALEVDSMWEYLTKIDPEAGELFSKSMTSFSSSFNIPIAKAYDFSKFRSINDIGGAHGSLVKAIVTEYPSLEGYVMDLPEVIEDAKKQENPENINFIGGDFFGSVGIKTDCQILRFIIHDWGDEDAIKILQTCRESIEDDGRILIADHLIHPDNQPGFEKVLDITMMVNYGTAKERTAEEFAALFEASGFKFNQVISTGTPFYLIEGIPV